MSSATNPPTVESLAQVVLDLQTQLHDAAESYRRLENQLAVAQQNNLRPHMKKNKPSTYSGKGSILSWITHLDNYLENPRDPDSLKVAASYLTGPAHEWWIAYMNSSEGDEIESWSEMKEALTTRFDTLNKEKIARDKLAHWKQIKDIRTFNEDFQKIILDIPNISMEEQVDRYSRGLKNYIWKDLCTNDYDDITEVMRDAERVEATHRRSGNNVPRSSYTPNSNTTPDTTQQPVPMEIGNVEIKKLTKEEREECMKKGLCLRCRQPGHIAKHCPKGKRD